MAGNEKAVVKYLMDNIGSLNLGHIGLVQKVENPSSNGELTSLSSIEESRTENSNKKADVFVNGYGVSIKQSGGNFAFNRLQRRYLWKLFEKMQFANVEETISTLDKLIEDYHEGKLDNRNRKWRDVFNHQEFFDLLGFLMMKGSQTKDSDYPADFILTAPASGLSSTNISVETFEEHFKNNSDKYSLALRRQWVGQRSESEHDRAVSMSKHQLNSKWVFDDIVGEPDSGWRSEKEFPIDDRKTVYMIFIELKKNRYFNQ